MTYFTSAEHDAIQAAANRMTLDKWTIIRIVHSHWCEAEYGEADDILKEASDATANSVKMATHAPSTIRRWMYSVDGLAEKYWTLTADRYLSFDHLDKARSLANRGWCSREEALDWAFKHKAGADEMVAHFLNPAEETPDQKNARRWTSTIGKVRHLLATVPVPDDKREAAELIKKGIELWETSSKKS